MKKAEESSNIADKVDPGVSHSLILSAVQIQLKSSSVEEFEWFSVSVDLTEKLCVAFRLMNRHFCKYRIEVGE